MKNKDYYFRHDYNPANDPKIICLLGNYGGLGYGVFWRLVEMLHQEKDCKLPLKKYIYEAIAKQMLTSAEQIQAIINECINTYELFKSDTSFFWSDRVLDNIKRQDEISNIRSIAGRAGAIAKQNLAKPTKESKVKEKNISKDIQNGYLLINSLITSLKEFNGLTTLDDTQGKNRQFAYLLIKHKITPEFKTPPTDEQIKQAFDKILSKADQFHKKNMTSFKYIYYNFNKIYGA